MPTYSYSLKNKVRDISGVLSTVIAKRPRFISLFKPVPNAINPKHEWFEDQIAGRGFTVVSVADYVVTVSEADCAKLIAGMLFSIKDNAALFKVASLDSTTTFTYALVASNGSATTVPVADDGCDIVGYPVKEGSSNGDGEETFRTVDDEYNNTQIIRKEIIIPGTTLATTTHDRVENHIARQTEFAMINVSYDLNRFAIRGNRVAVSSSTKGMFGGLYYFGTQTGCLSLAAGGSAIDSFMINDAAQLIRDEGGEADTILCTPGQGRVLALENKDKMIILRTDTKTGSYVATVTDAIDGRDITIFADSDFVDTEPWVVDSAGFGFAHLAERKLKDEDVTPKGFDGIKRMALGEVTLEFKNSKQRLCRITGAKASATALAAANS